MCLLTALILAACSGSDDAGNGGSGEPAYLDVSVSSPDRILVSRADVGDITASDAESMVNSLKVWVFRSDNGSLMGYASASTTDDINTQGRQTLKMKVPNSLADNPVNVDVYAVANEASYALTLHENTSRAELEAAVVGSDYFGTTTLVTAVPAGGLPMSAVLKNQPLRGSFPTLRIGTDAEAATLQLTRAVSKLRFVLCRKAGEQDSSKPLVSIDDISLVKDQIPTTSWLLPRLTNGYSYSHAAVSFGGITGPATIPEVDDPMVYAYETQEAQAYEDMINQAVQEGKLKQLGLTYLRESDKQLTGTIRYTYKDGGATGPETQTTATFVMSAAGDFLRNHSWIVYIYYMDSKIYTLTVTHVGMKSWIPDNQDENSTFYNW